MRIAITTTINISIPGNLDAWDDMENMLEDSGVYGDLLGTLDHAVTQALTPVVQEFIAELFDWRVEPIQVKAEIATEEARGAGG